MSSWYKKLNSEPDNETLVNVGPNSTNAGVSGLCFVNGKSCIQLIIKQFQ